MMDVNLLAIVFVAILANNIVLSSIPGHLSLPGGFQSA